MAFPPTPPRNSAPSQLLSLGSILANTGGASGAMASVALTSVPSGGAVGGALTLGGNVAPAGTAVQVGLSTSATTSPSSWINATVSGANWTASITPSTAGAYYVWAEQTAATSVKAVSARVIVLASGGVTITSPPATGTVGVALSLTGTVSPSGAAVQVGLATSATTAPAGWTNATVNGTGWTANLTPSAAGTYYIWAEQTATTAIQAVSAAVAVAASGSSGTVAITSPPTTGTAGVALSLAGTVAPSGTAVQVGLSTSASTAPSSWTNATVSGTGWTASLTPSAAATYYIWAEQTSAPSVQAVSAVVTVSAAGGSALSYSLISGSGNGSLSGITLQTLTSAIYSADPATDWTSSIAVGATDVMPGIFPSSIGSITACKFWFDSSATNTTVPSTYGNQASTANGAITFYPFSYGYGTPTCVPAAPSTAGTYYGKYAMYNSSGTLLGVFVTSAITVH
jgi:hypothetical protein